MSFLHSFVVVFLSFWLSLNLTVQPDVVYLDGRLTTIHQPEPVECRRPPDDYRRVKVNGYTVNGRTFAMLEYAAELYGGEIDVAGQSITQGSYSDDVAASFGTHAGGGAVDISLVAPNRARYVVLYDDISALIRALRLAGFAAWYRKTGELGPGSPLHIHAVAVGDRELSRPGQEQLIGAAGYFRGYNGLPLKRGHEPVADTSGGPVICQWMLDMGYEDLTGK
jgi:hypothetical protein